MHKPEDQILRDLQSLLNQYEAELDFLQNRNMNQFDVTVLPKPLQDMISLATAKTPSFSNIASLSVATFVLSHTFGQLRPVINDPIYSDDTIGINTYNLIISRSGSGKDSTYQALGKALHKSTEYINQQTVIEAEESARTKYIKEMKRANDKFDESQVTKDDYVDFIKKPEVAITSLASTRGGLTTSLNRMTKSAFGIKSLFASELGLAIQSNKAIVEVLELFSILYDMGQSVAPEFKTDEAKEESVEGMYPNLLGISSPAPFYTEGNVRSMLVPMLTTSLARRITVVFSKASEEFENEYIPKSPAEKRQIQAQQRVVLMELTNSLNEHFLKCTKALYDDPVIMFNDEASAIYDDYLGYTKELSKSLLLRNGDSVEGIEMSGRAFKLGRIAATWAIAQNTRIIDADTLKAAIYYCDYTAQHLLRFAETLELKDYELFINDWQNGFFDNVLPIDQAITRGYISTKQITSQSITNFLKPVNSRLEGIATVSYNDKSNAFIFVPSQKNLSGEYSYRACQGHVVDKPINNIAVDKPLTVLTQLLSVNSSFNPFAADSAKFIALSVSESFLSMQMLSKYLSKVHHFIGTQIDPNNHHAFTLILPVSSIITQQDYKYIVMSLANQLMLKVAPEFCEHDTLYYGYANAQVLQSTDSTPSLFDISGILGNLASGVDVPLLATKPAVKPTLAQITKYFEQDILEHKQTLIEMLDASSNPLLLFASIVYDLKMHYLDEAKLIDFINNVNASLIKSIPESVVTEFLIEPFKGL